MAQADQAPPGGIPCFKCGNPVPFGRHYCKACGERVREIGAPIPPDSSAAAPKTVSPVSEPNQPADPGQTIPFLQPPAPMAPAPPVPGYPSQPGTPNPVAMQVKAALEEERNLRRLNKARITLFVVGFLILLGAFALWALSDKDVMNALDPDGRMKRLNAEDNPFLGIQIFSYLIMGLIYVVLGIFSVKQPFKATLYGLILFITSVIAGLLIGAKLSFVSLIVDAVIIIILLNGIRSALAYNASMKRNAGR